MSLALGGGRIGGDAAEAAEEDGWPGLWLIDDCVPICVSPIRTVLEWIHRLDTSASIESIANPLSLVINNYTYYLVRHSVTVSEQGDDNNCHAYRARLDVASV